MSLSARRAWIEIDVIRSAIDVFLAVALRKESVDRNHLYASSGVDFAEVALRKESVDRNWLVMLPSLSSSACRSPQGERG